MTNPDPDGGLILSPVLLTAAVIAGVLLLAVLVLLAVLLVLVARLGRSVRSSPTSPEQPDDVDTPPMPTTDGNRSTDWSGTFVPFAVGDPGRAAANVRPKPDPRSWDRRDSVLDGVSLLAGTTALGELRAASLRGLSHANYGTVRQDEYAYRQAGSGRYLVMVVSDGVSSGKLSEQAAMVVARRGADMVVDQVERHGPQAIPWPSLLHGLAAQVEDRGRILLTNGTGPPPTGSVAGELAATALFAVVDFMASPGGGAVAHLMSVGDSSAWVLRDGRWALQTAEKNAGAQIASSATAALPLLPHRLADPIRVALAPGDALALVSDGIGDALGSGDTDVGGFLADVWARPPQNAIEFAAHVAFARRSFDDDRTAVVLWTDTETGHQV